MSGSSGTCNYHYKIIFNGRNDNSQDVTYGLIEAYLMDASDGTEDAEITIRSMVAGTSTNRIDILPTETVLNQSSFDLDFRVESNGNANMLFVDGGNNAVGIGTGSPSRLLELSNTTNPAIRLNNGNSNVDIGVASSAGALLTGVADDNLVIARNGAFGISFGTNGSLGLNIDATGAVTMPLQPAFQVHKNGTDQDNFAHASNQTVTWSHANFDQGSDFDLGNNSFVAPVTGQYQFNVNMRLENTSDGANYYIISIITSSGSYQHIFDPDVGQDQVYWPVSFSILAGMAATHTAHVVVLQENSGTGGQTDIDGQRAYTNFSGFLVA